MKNDNNNKDEEKQLNIKKDNIKKDNIKSEIENEKGPLEKSLKDFILNFYGIVNKFDSHFQTEFQKNLEKHERRNLRREKILNEVRKKERKIQAIEEEFGFYTPINKKARYKIRGQIDDYYKLKDISNEEKYLNNLKNRL